jgi:AraC-like DNA-binding protein
MNMLNHSPAADDQLSGTSEAPGESSSLPELFIGIPPELVSTQGQHFPLEPNLPFARHLQAYSSPESAASHLSRVLPISSICNTQPDSAWHFQGFHATIGDISIGVVSQSAATLRFAEDTGIQLIYCPSSAGYFEPLTTAIQDDCNSSGCRFKLLAWSGPSCQISLPAGTMVYLSLAADQAIKMAKQMSGQSIEDKVSSEYTHCVDEYQINQSNTQAILYSLLRGLDLVDGLLSVGTHLPLKLELEQLLYRLALLLLFPDLHNQDQIDRVLNRSQRGKDSFDELLEFIQANLEKSLSMPMLEAYSHYSRRAIQYAFRERLGCTATQWIRQQRLQMARECLQAPLPGDTVNSIALRCGYRSASLFSMEFQQRYLIKPSSILRQSRPCDSKASGAAEPEPSSGLLP